MRHRCFRALIFAAIALSAPLLAQSISDDEFRWGSRPYVPQQPNAIRVRTNVVQVPVVVRDSNGKALGGLKKSDFELYDNGHQVEIASFTVENASPAPVRAAPPKQSVESTEPGPPPPSPVAPHTPRYIAFFFDDTSMRVSDTVFARKAAESFVKNSLKPGDKIGIFTTSTTVSLNFTDNAPKLLETLALLRTRQRKADSGGSDCPLMNPY